MNDTVLPDRVLREVIVEPVSPAGSALGGGAVFMGPTKSLSYVEEHEVPAAKALINQQFKDMTGRPFGYRPAGYFVAVRIYVRPEELKEGVRPDGSKYTIYLPDVVRAEDKYQSCAALVCAVGPQAYKGKDMYGNDRFPEGPWCRVGDWVAIPRYESFLVTYRGVPMALLPDDKILGILEDPTDVAPIHQTARI